MADMRERLTEKQSAGYDLKALDGEWCNHYCHKQRVETCNECGIYQAIQKLAYYEDLEEQGKLLVLPCKVGDKIYRVDTDPLMPDREITEFIVDNIVICDNGEILFKYDSYDGVICTLDNLVNKKPYLDYYMVSLSKAEAEQALKEREQ